MARTTLSRQSLAGVHHRRSHDGSWKGASSSRLRIESLEARLVLTQLAELIGFGGAPQFVSSPASGAHDTAAMVPRTEDPDLVFLANHVPADELAGLERVDTPLLTLLGRYLQGRSANVSEQTLDGSRYADFYSTQDGRPHVMAYVRDVDEARPQLERIGMAVTAVTDTANWQVVAGYLPIPLLRAAASVAGLIHLEPSALPVRNTRSGEDTRAGGGTSGGGPEVSGVGANEWDALSGAAQLRRVLPSITGAGIEVGVMSDSINQVGGGLAASQGTGDLPAGVVVLSDFAGGSDEGRAMAELVYDLGPDLALTYHTAFVSQADFAQGIEDLRVAGADVVVDDVTWGGEPFFQDGQIAQAVDNAYLNHGVLYFSSAGNRNGESYYAPWLQGGASTFHSFSPGDETLDVTLSNNEQLRLHVQWDEPWGGAATDIDIEIWNAALTAKVADSGINNLGGNPYDFLTFTNTTGAIQNYHLTFRHSGGVDPAAAGRVLKMIAFNNDDDFTDPYAQNEPGTIGHHGSQWGFGIGAVPWDNPGTIEDFSSHGPNDIYFTDAGVRLASPTSRQQPLFTAADGTETTVPGFVDFFGTSAAAPNAAAVAALMLEAAGGADSLTWTQTRNIMRDTAVGTNAGGPWDPVHGYGRINALGAGLVANGAPGNEYYLEANPFGDAILDNNLFANSDIDRATFAFDLGGATTINAAEGDAVFDPAMILWDGETSGFLEIDYEDGIGDDPFISRSLSSFYRYQVAVFSETDVTSAASTDFSLTVNGPDQPLIGVTLNDDGDASLNGIMDAVQDSDYYRLVAPIDLNLSQQLTLSLTNVEATLDPVLTLYDSAGTVIQRADVGLLGGGEQIIASSLTPGATYYVRVGSYAYASEGDFTLNVNFTSSVFPAVWSGLVEGYAVFHGPTGISNDALSFNAMLDFSGDMDSYWFAGDTGWSGNYTLTATDLGAGVDTILAVYDGTTRQMLAFDDDGGTGLNSSLTASLSSLTTYIVVVGDFGNDTSGDLAITITAPGSFVGANIPINAAGNGSSLSQLLNPAADTDFYRFTAPANSDGTVQVVISPDAALNSVGYLFDAAGNELARATNGATGADDTLVFNGVVPATEYYLSVLSSSYASSGGFDVFVDFGIAALVGDFNGDGAYDCTDVNALVARIASGLNPPAFDLNGDTLVNLADLTLWLSIAATFNGFGSPYRPGDANLDGFVDASDFGLWNANKYTATAAWCSGDFNADGFIDASDFGLWNANKFQSSDAARGAVVRPADGRDAIRNGQQREWPNELYAIAATHETVSWRTLSDRRVTTEATEWYFAHYGYPIVGRDANGQSTAGAALAGKSSAMAELDLDLRFAQS